MTDAAGVRRAGPDDVPALVELRALMLADMGVDVGDASAPWRRAATDWFADRTTRPAGFAAFVAEDGGVVVSCAVGVCDIHAPSPANLSGIHGHISNMSTRPAHRRKGYARACLTALLDWFARDTEARVINLNATSDGQDLYASLGFAAPRNPALQLRTNGSSPTSARIKE